MDIILCSAKWQFALVYLDDVVIFSKSPDDHIDNVRQFLAVLKDAGATLKLRKCKYSTNCMDYFVHVIKSKCLPVISPTFDAICILQTPSYMTDVRLFVGLYDVLRRFVRNVHGSQALFIKNGEWTSPTSTPNYSTKSSKR